MYLPLFFLQTRKKMSFYFLEFELNNLRNRKNNKIFLIHRKNISKDSYLYLFWHLVGLKMEGSIVLKFNCDSKKINYYSFFFLCGFSKMILFSFTSQSKPLKQSYRLNSKINKGFLNNFRSHEYQKGIIKTSILI